MLTLLKTQLNQGNINKALLTLNSIQETNKKSTIQRANIYSINYFIKQDLIQNASLLLSNQQPNNNLIHPFLRYYANHDSCYSLHFLHLLLSNGVVPDRYCFSLLYPSKSRLLLILDSLSRQFPIHSNLLSFNCYNALLAHLVDKNNLKEAQAVYVEMSLINVNVDEKIASKLLSALDYKVHQSNSKL